MGVARQGDVFIFRSPIGNLGDAEYLTCCKLSRSDFVEPFKRSTPSDNGANDYTSTYLQNGLCPLYKPIGKRMGGMYNYIGLLWKNKV